MQNISKKNEILEITRQNNFYLKTTSEVVIKKLKDVYLLAYLPSSIHPIFNEVTCTLLKQAQESVQFIHLIMQMHSLFNVDIKLLKKDLLNTIPLLALLDFIKIKAIKEASKN